MQIIRIIIIAFMVCLPWIVKGEKSNFSEESMHSSEIGSIVEPFGQFNASLAGKAEKGLELKLSTGNKVYFAGDSIGIEFILKNIGNETIKIKDSWKDLSIGRQLGLRIFRIAEKCKEVDIGFDYYFRENFLTSSAPIKYLYLAPNEDESYKPYEVSNLCYEIFPIKSMFILNEYYCPGEYKIEKYRPGKYLIYGVISNSNVNNKSDIWSGAAISKPLEITILPPYISRTYIIREIANELSSVGPYLRALQRLNTKNFQLALDSIRICRSLINTKNYPGYLYISGYLNEILGNEKEAESFYDFLLNNYPSSQVSNKVKYRTAMILFIKGEYRKAKEALLESIFLYPDYDLMYYSIMYLFEIYRREEKFIEGVDIIEKAIRKFPDFYQAELIQEYVCLYYDVNKHYKKAINNYEFLLQIYPSVMDCRFYEQILYSMGCIYGHLWLKEKTFSPLQFKNDIFNYSSSGYLSKAIKTFALLLGRFPESSGSKYANRVRKGEIGIDYLQDNNYNIRRVCAWDNDWSTKSDP